MAKKGLFGWFSSDEEEEIESGSEEYENSGAGPIPEDELTAFLTRNGDFSDDEDQSDRYCSCGVILNPEWSFCPMCGKRLRDKPERYCPRCEEQAEESWDYCPKCGHLIDEEI